MGQPDRRLCSVGGRPVIRPLTPGEAELARDAFGEIALETWSKEGIAARVVRSDGEATGAAYIYVNDRTGENAIIVVPGAAGTPLGNNLANSSQRVEPLFPRLRFPARYKLVAT